MARRITAHLGALALALATFGVSPGVEAATSPGTPWDPFFASPTTAADFGAAAKPYGVAAGDFNGDGNPDMVVGRSTGNATGLAFATPATVYDSGVSNGRTYGVAVGTFDGDSYPDLVVGRYTGHLAFLHGNGDGTFAAAVSPAWKQTTFNTWAVAPADVNADGFLDLVWGSQTAVAGCSQSGTAYNTQATCTTAGYTWEAVNDGDVRAFLGNGDGTFKTDHTFYVSGVLHNAGTLLGRPGTADAASLVVTDVDGNTTPDIVVGAVDGANTTVKLMRNSGGGSFTVETAFISQPTAVTTATSPIYFPATTPSASPWGLAFADMTGDGKPDLLVGDRALYVYLFVNDGSGHFAMQTGYTAVAGRPNVMLGHDSLRYAVGLTPYLSAGDVNRDGRPDVVLGLHSGSQTAAQGSYDGSVVVDVSSGVSSYLPPSVIGNIGFGARGINVVDLTGDGLLDVVGGSFGGTVKRITQQPPVLPDPNVSFVPGNSSGGYDAPVPFDWRLESGNASGLTAGDLNHDGKLDLVWGATVEGVAGGTVRVSNGDVRVLYGNGDGTFVTNGYTRSGATYAAGTLLARIGPDGSAASSLAVGDVNHDGWPDVVAGGLDASGSTTVVQLIRNNADGTFALDGTSIVAEPTATTQQSPVYWPPTTLASTPWGLALGDANGDGDLDLFVGDRAQYVYRFDNSGSGAFTLHVPTAPPIDTKPNVTFDITALPDLGYTPSLAAGDFNGDGNADVAIGLYSAGANYAGAKTNDGGIYLALSSGSSYVSSGLLADIGTQARGLTAVDLNGDGVLDLLSGTYGGTVMALRQLVPKDTDGDGISDYVDNAPTVANAPRIDLNSDGATNRADQLDNDHDTVLGDPENSATWQRLGDAVDPDDDNDGVLDTADNCTLVANADQADRDGDGVGDACDPLDNRDPDADGVPNSILPGDPLYDAAKAAAAKWASASTHFVIRIDALGRWWQSEFTQTLSDAAMQPDESSFEAACTANYANGHNGLATPDCAAMTGGKNLPVTLATIPKLLWTDPAVVTWINQRIAGQNLEIGQHGTYHVDNIPNGDLAWWSGTSDVRAYTQCETCGLTKAEDFELLKVGQDTLLGNYGNPWIASSNPAVNAPRINWSGAGHPLLTYIAPYDTSDTISRAATSELGYRGFSASAYEESGGLAPYLSPEGSHMEAFDQFGMFHASADQQVSPSDVAHLSSIVQPGGLNTWLIEEVDWSGKTGADVNGTVDMAKWPQWLQLLDFVKSYPDSVAMTIGEVALAKAFDNAPTVPNADQADSDHNGIGDVVDGAQLTTTPAALTRDVAGSLSATLTNGAGAPIAGQHVAFQLDADADGTAESYPATTSSTGVATASVTPTRPPGATTFGVSWDGGVTSATGTGSATVKEAADLALDPANPTSGQLGDPVTVKATLTSSHGDPLAGRSVTLAVGTASASATTDTGGVAQAALTLPMTGGDYAVTATFAGDSEYLAASDRSTLTVLKRSTTLTLDAAVPSSGDITDPVTVGATLTDSAGTPVSGVTVTLSAGAASTTRTTDATGHASAALTLVAPSGAATVGAGFAGNGTYGPASASKAFTVNKEATSIVAPASSSHKAKGTKVTVQVRLIETDGTTVKGVSGRTLRAYAGTTATVLATATTDSTGYVSVVLTAPRTGSQSVQFRFAGDTSYGSSLATTVISR